MDMDDLKEDQSVEWVLVEVDNEGRPSLSRERVVVHPEVREAKALSDGRKVAKTPPKSIKLATFRTHTRTHASS